MTDTPAKPLPMPDDLTRPFWDAARARRLDIQRCGSCGYYNHPPRPLCDACGSESLAFEPVSGKGTVYSYTVMRQRNVKGFEEDVPYVNIIVELDEQPMLFMITYLPGSEEDRVRIGQRVRAIYEERDGVVLPQFEMVED